MKNRQILTDADIAAYLAGMMYCAEWGTNALFSAEKFEEMTLNGPMFCAYGWFDGLYEMGHPSFRKRGLYVTIE